jgi:hypothetical protein
MMDKTIEIDLKKFAGPVYTGRPRGEAIRLQINLDKIDTDPSTAVKIIVPEETFSLNSSFFLGLLGPSVRASGTREKFLEKFDFQCPDHILEFIDSGIERALQDRVNLLHKK